MDGLVWTQGAHVAVIITTLTVAMWIAGYV